MSAGKEFVEKDREMLKEKWVANIERGSTGLQKTPPPQLKGVVVVTNASLFPKEH